MCRAFFLYHSVQGLRNSLSNAHALADGGEVCTAVVKTNGKRGLKYAIFLLPLAAPLRFLPSVLRPRVRFLDSPISRPPSSRPPAK